MNIAFVTFGKSLNHLGKILTFSLRKSNPNSNIIQITDDISNKINGIDDIIIHSFDSNKFMFDRLNSQILTLKKFGPTIFLDTDMIVVKNLYEIHKLLFKFDLIISKRSKNFMLKESYNDLQFPEFRKKLVNEIMPYNGGFVACKNIESLELVQKYYLILNENYFKWFGDQIAIKRAIDEKKFLTKIVKEEIYNYSPVNYMDFKKEVAIYHFKGGKKEWINKFIEEYYN